jgi:hypothetical protein
MHLSRYSSGWTCNRTAARRAQPHTTGFGRYEVRNPLIQLAARETLPGPATGVSREAMSSPTAGGEGVIAALVAATGVHVSVAAVMIGVNRAVRGT